MGEMAQANGIAEPAKVDFSDRKAELEQKYVALLEQRIAALESLLKESAIETKSTTSDSTATKDSVATNGDSKPKLEIPDDEKKGGDTVNGDTSQDVKSPKESSDAPAPRVKAVISKWVEANAAREDTDVSTSTKETEGGDKKQATIFRRVMDEANEKKLQSEEIEINTMGLRRLYHSCCRHIAPLAEDDSGTLRIFSPFENLVWSWDAFTAASQAKDEGDDEETRQAREDLKEVLALVRRGSHEQYFRIRDSMAASRSIKFEFLWTLFPLKTKVYAKTFMDDLQMLEVHFHREEEKSFVLQCSAFDWDGIQFRLYRYEFIIDQFDGEKPINQLEAYPIEYYKNADGELNDTTLRQQLVKRGQKFHKICTSEPSDFLCEYSGSIFSDLTGIARLTSGREADDAASSSDNASNNAWEDDPEGIKFKSIDITGKVIVDNLTFMTSARNPVKFVHPPIGKRKIFYSSEFDCKCDACASSVTQRWRNERYSSPKHRIEGFVKDHDRLCMCPPKLLGYVLEKKLWAQLGINDLKQIDREADTHQKSFFAKELQLDEDYKKMLLAFVKNHESSRRRRPSSKSNKGAGSFDIVPGKGQGLAILLHGPPGVGKTLTAETIAMATDRPLLTVSVAEIGIDAENAENRLSTIFADAQRWEAVLLIDEADVFLEERVRSDNPSRNAMVSVLLRCLEYYQGIIILTTNRIKSIDIAVQSRMHLAIQYRDLDLEQKINIFKNFMGKMSDSQLERRDIYSRLKGLCKNSGINGRQIRNIVSSAQALAAEDDDRAMTLDDIDQVHRMTKEFLDSLRDMTSFARGQNEATRGL